MSYIDNPQSVPSVSDPGAQPTELSLATLLTGVITALNSQAMAINQIRLALKASGQLK